MGNHNRNKDFYYKERNKRTEYAAQEVMRILSEYINPNSVVDIGGGVGTWVKCAMKQFGINENDALLIENPSVGEFLEIPNSSFLSQDLENEIRIEKKFDMAISLEVAEHLSANRAESFIQNITELSNVVLFSAALPFQGGKGHINERPLSFWCELFRRNSYMAYDVIRPIIQNDKDIDYWYRQNLVLFVKNETPEYNDIFMRYKPLPPLSMISYDLYSYYIRKPFKYPFFELYQRIFRKEMWNSWKKTNGATEF